MFEMLSASFLKKKLKTIALLYIVVGGNGGKEEGSSKFVLLIIFHAKLSFVFLCNSVS